MSKICEILIKISQSGIFNFIHHHKPQRQAMFCVWHFLLGKKMTGCGHMETSTWITVRKWAVGSRLGGAADPCMDASTISILQPSDRHTPRKHKHKLITCTYVKTFSTHTHTQMFSPTPHSHWLTLQNTLSTHSSAQHPLAAGLD